MKKYLYKGESSVILMDFHKDVNPGDTVEVDGVINHPHFEEVKETKPKGEK